jgi:lipid-A-disaccharide synthase
MRLCVVAGEASGDLHAAGVVRELRTLDPSLEAFGFGGDLLEAEGVRILHHVRELGIVGLFNVIRHLSMFRVVFGELLAEIRRQKPDVVLLVDYPDFNLRLAAKVKAMGIPVVYFISPQVWAWRKRRVHAIARNVDHMLVLFPFEVDFYRRFGVEATYVGHPLLEQLEHVRREDRVPDETGPVRIALMPGSRKMEIEALLPDMLDAVSLMSRKRRVDAFIIRASTISEESIRSTLREKGLDLTVVKQDGGRALAGADIALSSSGTATLEAAIVGVPVVVMYRLNRPTFALARLLVDLPHFSLVNIVAESRSYRS